MHDKYQFQFNAKAIIEHFGGLEETTRALNEMGSTVTFKAVEKMRFRNMMQSDVLATLMAWSAHKGITLDPYEFLAERK